MSDIIDTLLKLGAPIIDIVEKWWWVIIGLPVIVIIIYIISKLNLFGLGGMLNI